MYAHIHTQILIWIDAKVLPGGGLLRGDIHVYDITHWRVRHEAIYLSIYTLFFSAEFFLSVFQILTFQTLTFFH